MQLRKNKCLRNIQSIDCPSIVRLVRTLSAVTNEYAHFVVRILMQFLYLFERCLNVGLDCYLYTYSQQVVGPITGKMLQK